MGSVRLCRGMDDYGSAAFHGGEALWIKKGDLR